MSRSTTTAVKHHRLVAIAPAALATLVAVALLGPARAAAQEEDAYPVVSNVVALPSTVPYLGGTVTISADVTDDVGVTDVSAQIDGTNGVQTGVALTLVS